MLQREFWPPAILAREIEKELFRKRVEILFNSDKENQLILIPGMGAAVSQLFELVISLRNDPSFQDYGITAVPLGLSLGDFHRTLEDLENRLKTDIFDTGNIKKIVLYGHSHGGRFASQLAVDILSKYPQLQLVVITGGTPIVERPYSPKNWLISLAFRRWPAISQPALKTFYALYSDSDEKIHSWQATKGSIATLKMIEGISHEGFRDPDKMIPEFKRLLFRKRQN